MEVIFLTECAVDGCYKKNQEGKQMCEKHQAGYDGGEKLIAFYGKTVQKKEFQEAKK